MNPAAPVTNALTASHAPHPDAFMTMSIDSANGARIRTAAPPSRRATNAICHLLLCGSVVSAIPSPRLQRPFEPVAPSKIHQARDAALESCFPDSIS